MVDTSDALLRRTLPRGELMADMEWRVKTRWRFLGFGAAAAVVVAGVFVVSAPADVSALRRVGLALYVGAVCALLCGITIRAARSKVAVRDGLVTHQSFLANARFPAQEAAEVITYQLPDHWWYPEGGAPPRLTAIVGHDGRALIRLWRDRYPPELTNDLSTVLKIPVRELGVVRETELNREFPGLIPFFQMLSARATSHFFVLLPMNLVVVLGSMAAIAVGFLWIAGIPWYRDGSFCSTDPR
ncbi:MAG: hypothetical protein LLG14_06695 [Nocardiaceae bacterium]|nr:hypothetical protein [Nocardiaceae bacterium]